MNGVKPAILPIVGIEVKTIQPIPITGLDGQLMENARPALTTVEIEISRELLRVLVENVKQAVQVNNEKAIRPSRFFSQTIDPCEQRVVAAFAVDQSGHRHRNVILDLEGDLCRCQCRPEAVQDDGQTRDAWRHVAHDLYPRFLFPPVRWKCRLPHPLRAMESGGALPENVRGHS